MKFRYFLLLILLLICIVAYQFQYIKLPNLPVREKKVVIQNSKVAEDAENVHNLSNSISINYINYEEQQRFVNKKLKLLCLPKEGSKVLRTIEPNTVVNVLDAAITDDKGLWIYVEIPVYDSPVNCKGWINEKDTKPISNTNMETMQGEITVKAGTLVYEAYEDATHISSQNARTLENDTRGRIEKKENGYVWVSSPGGWGFWVEEQYVNKIPQAEERDGSAGTSDCGKSQL